MKKIIYYLRKNPSRAPLTTSDENLFKAGVSIRGGFVSTADEFDDDRHQVCVNMNASIAFKKELAFTPGWNGLFPM